MRALKLVSTKTLSREEWLQWRHKGIGSSDAAAAVGKSPYTSPLALWLEKTGRKAAEDLSQKEAVRWGTLLEPLIAQAYAEQTGKKVRRVNAILQHPEHPYLLANLDRVVEGGGILEIKTAGLRSQGLWEEGIPEHYRIQVLHQLLVTGKSWAEVAVLIGGQEFRTYRIEPEGGELSELLQAEQAFWQHVRDDTPPEADGSESSGKALQWLYPRSTATLVDYTDHAAMNALFRELLQARAKRKAAEVQEAILEQRMKESLGDAEGAVFELGKVLWKSSKDSRTLDTQKLIQEHPEWAEPYRITKPGSRRFTVQAE
ncbi:YqaJ viral recombinase family protein [Acidithiobacillus caldus]|uniref:Endonuclease n=1 Tax=Acidithiobacillus caldus TaxID=33059 RepID=A0A1E7YL52_9PROT|nr:YqaJ viral recombinase family protein [Acidithiobacillus caldus]OFC30626.1 endonuclease [Acidithiobacillus caldus]OFC32308.1 endonuclease [Acidithiobacillus caldus]OFC39439.1 endonuclease [Acidithiobacillus caldus]